MITIPIYSFVILTILASFTLLLFSMLLLGVIISVVTTQKEKKEIECPDEIENLYK